MNTSINDILIEWAYRVKDGKPNPKSIRDRIVLESVLKDFGWNVVQRNALIENLTEAPDNKPLSKQDKDKIKKMGLIWKGKGYGKENEEGILYKNVDGKLVSVDKKGDEKQDDAGKLDKKSDFERDTDPNKGASSEFQRGGEDADDSEAETQSQDYTKPPEKETTSQRDKRRAAHNKQADNKIKNSENAESTAAELIEERRGNIRNAYDLPAGTPASTTGETYGGVAAEQLTENPNLTEEDFVENEIEKMRGTPLYDMLIEKAKAAKEFKKDPEKYVRQWLSIGFKTGQGELDYLQSEEKFKYKKPQTKPYPISATMDYNQKQIVQSLLEKKRDEHEEGSEEYKHYQTQLDYLEKLDDTDTGTLYETTDGRIGFKHTSNKKDWTDPHNNTSVRKKGEKISKAVDANEDLSDSDREKVVEATTNAVERAATTVDNAEKAVGEDSQNLSPEAVEGVGKIFEFFDPRRIDYVQEMRTNPAMKKKLESKGIDPEKATEQEIAEAVIEMVKDGSATQDIQKMVLKTSDVVSRVRQLNKVGLKQYGGPMSVSQIAKHLKMSEAAVKECLDSKLDDIEDTSRKRKDSMNVAHEQLVGDLQKADSELDSDSYPNNPDGDNGPNQRAYVQSFMDEIHFTRYINGELEGIQSINIGGTSVSPTEFRECCAELSNFDGDIESEQGRKDLMNHLQKRLRVSPDDDAVSFGSKEGGKERELGRESYRTKGKSKSILAHLGKDMIKCLKGKN